MSLDALDQDLLSLGYIPSSEIIGSNVYISSTLLNNPKLLPKVCIPDPAFTTSIKKFSLVYQQMLSVSNFCQASEYSLLQTDQLKPIAMALMHSLVGNEIWAPYMFIGHLDFLILEALIKLSYPFSIGMFVLFLIYPGH